ncbi:hypothetical protein ACFSTD_24100 [Novosphingobium colocasiae]
MAEIAMGSCDASAIIKRDPVARIANVDKRPLMTQDRPSFIRGRAISPKPFRKVRRDRMMMRSGLLSAMTSHAPQTSLASGSRRATVITDHVPRVSMATVTTMAAPPKTIRINLARSPTLTCCSAT